MTRKDYILIARALNNASEPRYWDSDRDWGIKERRIAREGVLAAAHYIANEMHDDNPGFDRDHFLAVVRGEKLLTSRPPR